MIGKKDIQALLVIAVFYIIIEMLGVTCPIKFITGISCAGCGMSRAWLSLLRGDISAAFFYHPLFWLPVPAAVILLLWRRLPRKAARGSMGVICALFCIVYVVRLFSPENTVVVFAPEEGAVFRLFSRLMG